MEDLGITLNEVTLLYTAVGYHWPSVQDHLHGRLSALGKPEANFFLPHMFSDAQTFFMAVFQARIDRKIVYDAVVDAGLRASANAILRRQLSKPRESLHGTECAVCMEVRPFVVLAPCGHRCICRDCASNVGACPVCRAAVASVVVRVYGE